jgi:hypothetical protein
MAYWDLALLGGVAVAALCGVGLGLRGRRKPAAAPAKPTPMEARRAAEARLKPAIERALKQIEARARRRAAIEFVTWIGAIDISPVHLAFWIFTTTDADRDRLAADKALRARLRAIVRRSGYPKAAIARVGFAFESKESVDRDWAGNYWYAMK